MVWCALNKKMRKAGSILGYATVALIVAAVAVFFADAGSWLSPGKLTPAQFVDRFEQVNGQHPGLRSVSRQDKMSLSFIVSVKP